ncbi:MAG: prepilin peptidase [Halobacteriovoraceae bacterium]|nr:prepilin peptidase [Halobacteriovoraceae bacterium]
MYPYFIFSIVFGLIVGSFLNMLIYRLPRDIGLLSPNRSFCPNCKKKLLLLENIPVISFVILKGSCSGCKRKISWQYPVIELVSAVLSFILFPSIITADNLMEYFFKYTIIASFVVHIIVDLKHKILPDMITGYLAAIFLFYSILHHSWTYWMIGGLIGYFFPLLVTWIFYKYRGIRGMGLGDIKLFSALGIYLGVYGIIHNIFLSCLIGSIAGIVLISAKKIKKQDAIPFGPFIILIAIFQIFFENEFARLVNLIFS